MSKPSSRLGRGLGSLIAGGAGAPPTADLVPSSDSVEDAKPTLVVQEKNALPSSPGISEAKGEVESLIEILLGDLVPNPHQPRKVIDPEAIRELAASIESEGLLQPVTVRKSENSYEMIAGERRWRAHEHLGRKTILARVLSASDLSSASLSLIENLQREGLNPIDEAMGYHSLVHDFSLTQAKVAERVGKSRAYVTNLLRLLQLDEELRGFLATGKLSTGHAKVLLGIPDEGKRLELGRSAVRENWTVRQCEQAVEDIRNPPASSGSYSEKSFESGKFSSLAKQAQTSLDRKVSIKAGPSGKGKLSLAFEDQEDLESLLATLGV
ncbi:MAG: ParB/RepB/Spo0J family partition protein [Opitutae bacterium]|nr:ParB/RepB/Spo0J family partition protein [Opitutae bacterium]